MLKKLQSFLLPSSSSSLLLLSSLSAMLLLSKQTAAEVVQYETCEAAFLTPRPDDGDGLMSSLSPGIWTSRGWGFAIEVVKEEEESSCTIYQETTVSCIEDTYFFDWYLIGNITAVDDNDNNNTTVSIDMDQQIDIVFDRTDDFQHYCAVGVTPSVGSGTTAEEQYDFNPLDTFDIFDQTFVELYAFFDVRGVDWETTTAEARATLTENSTSEELFDAMAACIGPLKDYHALIRVGKNGTSFESQPLPIYGQLFQEFLQQDAIENPEVYFLSQVLAWQRILTSYMDDGSAGGAVFDPGVFWGTMDNGDIGYLQLNSVGWGDSQEEIFETFDSLMTLDFANVTTLILDLRINEGGNDRSGLRFASYFVPEVTEAFFQRTMIYPGNWTPNATVFIEPDDIQFAGERVILITSNSCGSACETLTIAMNQVPTFDTSIGRNTIGALSYNTQRRMDNDFLVYTSPQQYFSPQGISYEGSGIPPEVVTETGLLPREERQERYDRWLELALSIARGEETVTPAPTSAPTPPPTSEAARGEETVTPAPTAAPTPPPTSAAAGMGFAEFTVPTSAIVALVSCGVFMVHLL